jgi:glycolate oxidase iron-sulfur subunit
MNAQQLVDYAASLDCIHCGLCLHTCPTYQLTGAEPSSPRGRIYLMRGVAEGRLDPTAREYAEELDFCLVCRHCESVCPAGVRFGEMMEHARDALAAVQPRPLLERWARRVGFGWLLRKRWALRASFGALRLAQRLGLTRLAALTGARGRALAALPAVPAGRDRAPLPRTTPALGKRKAVVALLEGCVMRELYGRVNRDTLTVLARLGLEVRCDPAHVCCGALHAHNGELAGARALARETIAALEGLGDGHVVVNSAGCGAHMKEYGRLLADDETWRERARTFASRVRDLSEVALEHAEGAPRRVDDLPGPLAWDDPCHLCHGQRIRSQPRALIDALSGVRRVELEQSESCCGSAGIYSLLRPGDSQDVLAPKIAALERSGAAVLVSANPGCQLQWESGLRRRGSRVQVLHLAELLARAR